jgi:L-aspartate oxidase
MIIETDILVIGSGIAGLNFALKASKFAKVTIITKNKIDESNTKYAQGGIAAVFSPEDSIEKHIQDTLNAGDGLCKLKAVEQTISLGPSLVQELIDLGVPFEKKGNDYDLGIEGGHRERRVLHSSDFTGAAIEKTLVEKIKENKNIKVYEHHIAIDLITYKTRNFKKKFNEESLKKNKCFGAFVLDIKQNKIITFAAPVTVLATGGAGKVYLYTTNPDTATGDGIAMAYRAGAVIANMEFMQFHPTCLFVPHLKSKKTFLISEALRGEGGILRNHKGEAFMEKYHKLKDLAPRDIVARAIDSEMKKHGIDCVYLDMTKLNHDFLVQRFPNIFQTCLSLGIDFRTEPIPVVPAAHYTCGGVLVDLNGQTSIENLFAIGEVACTGLHGANRLASNSLLEGLVYAHLASLEIEQKQKNDSKFFSHIKNLPEPLPTWDSALAIEMEEQIDIHHTWKEIRTLMWNYVSIVRTNDRLEKAKKRLDLIKNDVQEYYWKYILTADLIELRNIFDVANLITQSAIIRKESRGLHFNTDYPSHDDVYFLRDTLL